MIIKRHTELDNIKVVKKGKWAQKILELQKEDGSWGYFHSLSDSWRAEENRIKDCTYRISNLLKKMQVKIIF